MQAIIDKIAGECVAVRLRMLNRVITNIYDNALRPLDEITGATTTDDILGLIFSTFCIGK